MKEQCASRHHKMQICTTDCWTQRLTTTRGEKHSCTCIHRGFTLVTTFIDKHSVGLLLENCTFAKTHAPNFPKYKKNDKNDVFSLRFFQNRHFPFNNWNSLSTHANISKNDPFSQIFAKYGEIGSDLVAPSHQAERLKNPFCEFSIGRVQKWILWFGRR